MCLHAPPIMRWPDAIEFSASHAPDCHLVLEVDNLGSRARALVDAVLRVDLGARVKPNTESGKVDIEGRFWKEDVIATLMELGYRLAHVEERPLSPRHAPRQWGWV